MVRYVGVKEGVVFSGGVAKNVGMVAALEKELKTKLLIPPEPQMIGAFGRREDRPEVPRERGERGRVASGRRVAPAP